MLLLTLSHAAWTSIERGDLVAAAKFTDEQHMIADEIGAAFWNSYALLQSAVIYTGTDRPKEAIEYFNAGFAAKNATGATVGEPRHKSFLALAHAALADFDGAKRYICEALAIVKTSGERHSEARILQCAGDIELACDPANSALAQSYYTRAIEVARRQHCRAFELIAALSLARLWRGQGKRQEAYDLLAPVYNWFTEGSEWTYMKQSKTLLDQLSAELRLG